MAPRKTPPEPAKAARAAKVKAGNTGIVNPTVVAEVKASYTIKSWSGTTLYVAKGAADVRAAVEAAAKARADLSGANLSRAYLSGANLSRAYLSGADLSRATGIQVELVNPLLILLDQPGAIRAYKLVDSEYRSPIQSTGKLTYTIGQTLEVKKADTDPNVQCGAGINVATLPWVMAEWEPGYHILVVEFTAADIAAIPIGDGKFRVRRCTVVSEKDLVALGLEAAKEAVA